MSVSCFAAGRFVRSIAGSEPGSASGLATGGTPLSPAAPQFDWMNENVKRDKAEEADGLFQRGTDSTG